MTTTAASEFMRRADAILPVYMARANDIDKDYFKNIAHDSEELPAMLDMKLRTQILSNMKQYAQQLLHDSGMDIVVRNLADSIADDAERRNVLKDFKDEVNRLASLEADTNGSSPYTLQDLNRLYEDAKTRTLWERLTNTNKEDVTKFHHALMEKTHEDCKDIFWGTVQDYALQIVKEISALF